MEKSSIVRSFEVFADDCINSSPLYEYLARKSMQDEELLELCTYVQKGQPAPNMLLGAVHHLLLQGNSHPLSQYYASIVGKVSEIEGAFLPFKQFCRANRADIIQLLQTKLVQTNEVSRTAYLYPTFAYIFAKTKNPLALIEIGTSAGLQLLFDQYHYSYGEDEIYGNHESSVQITSEIRGENKPRLPMKSPPISHRIGIDLHVNDLSNRDDYLWLLSLIWPEHHERLELFKEAARTVQMSTDLQLIEGDGIHLLPEVVRQIPKTSTLCIFHTHVANQLSSELKQALLANIKEIGQERDVFHLYNNVWDGDLHLDSFVNGDFKEQVIGETNSHGKWFTWNLH